MSDLLVQVFAFVQWPRFAQAPVNMRNAAKTGAPDARTEARSATIQVHLDH
jgi:hypothetical protein